MCELTVDRNERSGLHHNGGGDWRRPAEHVASTQAHPRATVSCLVSTDVRRCRILSSAWHCASRSQVRKHST